VIKEKAAKQEILLVRRANLASTKLHLVSVKIVHPDSTLMAKVREVVQNVLPTPTCLNLASRQKQIVHHAPQIVLLEILLVTSTTLPACVSELSTTRTTKTIASLAQPVATVLHTMVWR
jgi:hypothetical protein